MSLNQFENKGLIEDRATLVTEAEVIANKANPTAEDVARFEAIEKLVAGIDKRSAMANKVGNWNASPIGQPR